ncbi:MAG: BapA/Bap/LapF family large adhesin, partial [Pseudomonadota bacterium]
TAEAGDTVTILDNGKAIGTATAGSDGSWSSTLPALADGSHSITTTVTDAAGNTGQPSAAIPVTVDTTAPAAASDVELTDGNGKNLAGADTNDNTPQLTGKATAGNTITVYDGTKAIGTTTVNSDGSWSITLSALADGTHSLTTKVTDSAGNSSDVSNAIAVTIDTQAPASATGITLVDDSGNNIADSSTTDTTPILKGNAEAGSTVTISDGSGTLGEATADSEGKWTFTTPVLTDGTYSFTTTVSDAAGNTSHASAAIDTTIESTQLLAVDDTASLDYTTYAEETDKGTSSKTGFSLLDLSLGDVLDLSLVNPASQLQLDVAKGTTENFVVQGDVGGLVASSFDLYIYKYDASSGEYLQYEKVSNWIVGLLAGVSKDLSLSLGEGTYLFLLNSGVGLSVATGYTLHIKSDILETYTSNSAETSGNLISGSSDGSGADTAPAGSVISSVNDTSVAASGYTTISGTYGTLSIDAAGDYTYKLNSGTDVADIGNSETFNYTLTGPNGNTSSATLTISLTDADTDTGTVALPDVSVDLDYATTSEETDKGTSSKTSAALLNLSLGSVLNTSLLNLNNQLHLNVADNTVENITIKATMVGVIASTYDLYVYKYDDETGQYAQYEKVSDWITSALLAGASSPLSLELSQGSYLFMLNGGVGLSVATVYTLSITSDVVNSVTSVATSTTGNLLTETSSSEGSDTVPTGTLITSVGTTALSTSGNTEITGQYGILTIDQQGDYTYTLNAGQTTDTLSSAEKFTYTLTEPDGTITTKILSINLNNNALKAVDDQASLDVSATEVESAYSEAVASGTLNTATSSSQTTTFGNEFSVDSNTVLTGTHLIITGTQSSVSATASLTLSYNIYEGSDATGTLVASGTVTPTTTLSLTQKVTTADIDLSDNDLSAGDYYVQISATSSATGLLTIAPTVSFSSTISGTEVSVSNFQTSSESSDVTGNLYDGTDSDGTADELQTVYTKLTVTNESDSSVTLNQYDTASQTLTGLYGTLTIHGDGSYSYALNSNINVADMTQKEMFSYTLTAEDGSTTSKANLTINLHPTITGTSQADTTGGTAYDDTFHLEGGADTVVYKVLSDDNTGGNGSDTWDDFSVSEGDHIDLDALLVGWDGKESSLGNYVSVTHTDSGNTVVSIDRDGSGSAYQSTTLVTLENVNATMDEILHHSSTDNPS